MNKKQLTKSQHFVPQVYLRYFSENPQSKKFSVWTFDKKTQSFSLRNVSKVCTQNFFYDITKSEVVEYANKTNNTILLKMTTPIINENQPLETFFSDFVEGTLFNTLKKIIALYEENKGNDEKIKSLKISEEDIYICSLYTYYQFLRTPKEKTNIDKSAENHHNQLLEVLDSYLGDQKDTAQLRKEINVSSTNLVRKQIHQELLLDIEHMTGMANIFYYKYKWIFLYSEESLFVTSDNPAFLQLYYAFKAYPLLFPLTPNICICLIDEIGRAHV